jgi:SAM-dependent methyltransferase
MDFKEFYDEQKEYSAFRNNNEKRIDYENIVRWKSEQLVKLIPADLTLNSILEIGCALGILLNNISERLTIKRIYGLDISSKNIELAKTLYPESTFFQGTVEDFKLLISNDQVFPVFDLVVLSDVIEHIPDDLKFLKSVKEISTYVMINLPLEKCFKNRHRNYGEDDPSGHLRCYDLGMALSLIDQAGFNIINSFTANAYRNKTIFKIYLKARNERLRLKSLPKRLFWKLFYLAEDRVKLVNNHLSERIYGTNYFALLKSR